MNKSIRLAAIFAILLTAILLVRLTVVQAFSDEKYADNPKNLRGFYEMQTTPPRGRSTPAAPCSPSPLRTRREFIPAATRRHRQLLARHGLPVLAVRRLGTRVLV